MAIRMKFRAYKIDQIEQHSSDGVIYHSVSLYAAFKNSPENSGFWANAPTGKIELRLVNSAAAEEFEIGTDYYVDFMRVE
jgi:hypothetical protein